MKPLFLLAITWVSLAPLAQGQARLRGPIIRFHAGGTIPQAPDDLSSYWPWGFTFGGAFGYRLSPVLSLEAGMSYNRFVFDPGNLEYELGNADGLVTGTAATIISAIASGVARMQTGSRVAPYLTAGLGVMRLSFGDAYVIRYYLQLPPDTANVSGDSETAFLAEAGFGLEVSTTKNRHSSSRAATESVTRSIRIGHPRFFHSNNRGPSSPC